MRHKVDNCNSRIGCAINTDGFWLSQGMSWWYSISVTNRWTAARWTEVLRKVWHDLISVEAPIWPWIVNYDWKLCIHLETIMKNAALAKSIPINPILHGQQVWIIPSVTQETKQSCAVYTISDTSLVCPLTTQAAVNHQPSAPPRSISWRNHCWSGSICLLVV